MDLDQVMTSLETMGTEQNRKIYRRHGVPGAQFGVSTANLKELVKQIKKAKPVSERQALARDLWSSGNYDARVLAVMLAEPALTTSGDLEQWSRDLDNYTLTDYFGDLAVRTAVGRELAERWVESDDEWLGRAGWHMLAQMAMTDSERPEAEYTQYIERIEREIHTRKNWVRHAMNNALIAIGARSPTLMEKALSAAHRIGKVEVDHGETNCKTPDAGSYILKTVAHRQSMAERAKTR